MRTLCGGAISGRALSYVNHATAMKKTKAKEKVKRKLGKQLVDADLRQIEDVRKQITNVIVAASLEMAKGVVRGVKRRGSVVGLRFLWGIAGILPKQAATGLDEDALSMKTLGEKLGLYKKLPTSGCARDEEVK
jgi:hypothetical protein